MNVFSITKFDYNVMCFNSISFLMIFYNCPAGQEAPGFARLTSVFQNSYNQAWSIKLEALILRKKLENCNI